MTREEAISFGTDRLELFGGKMDEFIKISLEALQERPKGHCKDCKWWKDKDGVYRRGISAESKCPINTKTVFLGEGYCYRFEPQESEEP